MKKTLALLLSLMMVLCLFTGCGDTATEPAAAADTAAEPAAAETADGGDWSAYLDYILAYAEAGAPSEEDFATTKEAIVACGTMDELLACDQVSVFFEAIGLPTFDEWVAQGCPAADTANVVSQGDGGTPGAEGSGEPAGGGGAVAQERSDDFTPGAGADDADYIAYLKAFVDACPAITDQTQEFYDAIEAGDFAQFPAEMLFNAQWFGFAGLRPYNGVKLKTK